MATKPKSIPLAVLSKHIARILDISCPDLAINGVQVENSGVVTEIITAVDFSEELLDHLIKKYALDDTVSSNKPRPQIAILVHHGIYWGKVFPVTGRYYRLYKKLIQYNIALLAYHLPLDVHPQIGNNILLLKALGCRFKKSFGDYKGLKILSMGTHPPITLNALVKKFIQKIGTPLAVVDVSVQGNAKSKSKFGAKIKTVGVCTGGGLFGIEDAKAEGCEVFITGDAGHTSYHQAKELGIHLICGGHYNTEVLGIKTLGEKVGKKFNLPTTFIDLPTRL